MKMKQMAKQSLCFLFSAGMVMNSGMMFNPPAYAAADSNVHEITVDGDVIDPVNTFRGFGRLPATTRRDCSWTTKRSIRTSTGR